MRRSREQWAPIPRFDAYEVSTRGRVRRVKRGEKNGAPLKVLRTWLGVGQQQFVSLRRDGRTFAMSVRFLQSVAFSEQELPA